MTTVRVVLQDGTLLMGIHHFDGMVADDVQLVLKEDGCKGKLYIGGDRLSPKTPIRAGSSVTFVEREPKDENWFIKHSDLPTASALANSASGMLKHLGTLDPIYDMDRVSAGELPLLLIGEPFRCYVKNLRACTLDGVDWNFVIRCMTMSGFFVSELDRQTNFMVILQEYLTRKMPGMTFRVTPSPVVGADKSFSSFVRDLMVEVLICGEWVLVLLVEVKPELGLRGEPSVELMRYYANHFIDRRSLYHWTYFESCCPVLLVEVVGANIRVGGAAFFDKPSHEPFTPYVHVHKFLPDNRHIEVLSKVLASIGPAVSSLVEFYTTHAQQFQQRQQGRVREPTITWPDFIRVEHSQGATITQYSRPKVVQTSQLRLQHVGREKLLVFLVSRPAFKRIIKFCQRYGVEVHEKWAALGCAPPFRYKRLDGDWLVVDMEYYSEQDGWLCLMALDPALFDPRATDPSFNVYRLSSDEWKVCKAAVQAAYLKVHGAHPSHVHGDLRRQNIMYNIHTHQAVFVDFDWASEDGRDFYPLFINNLVTWPTGVGGGQPMTASHDAALLNLELGLSLPY